MDMFYRYSLLLLLISVAVFKSEVIPGIKNNFPIGEIVPIIPKKYTDKYLCGSNRKTDRCCSCDKDCLGKKSCCIDYLWNYNKINDVSKYLKNFTKVTFSDKIVNLSFECRSLFAILPKYGQTQKSSSYYMVSICPKNKNKAYKRLCENPTLSNIQTNIPVVNKAGYIFKNSYCAECNNVFDYRIADIDIKCKGQVSSHQIQNFTKLDSVLKELSSCDLSIRHREKEECIPFQNECERKNEYYSLCTSFNGILQNKFKNYFCYLCSEDKFNNDSNIFSCRKTTLGPNFFSLELTISYGQVSVQSSGLSETLLCPKGSAYNMQEKNCEELGCPLDKTKCKDDFTGPTKLGGSHSFVPYYNYFSYMLVTMPESENITDGNFSLLQKLNRFIRQDKKWDLTISVIPVSKCLIQLIFKKNETTFGRTNFESFLSYILRNFPVDVVFTNIKPIDTFLYCGNVGHTFPNRMMCIRPTISEKFVSVRNIKSTFSGFKYFNTTITWFELNGNHLFQKISKCDAFHLNRRCADYVKTEKFKIHLNRVISLKDAFGNLIYLKPEDYLPSTNGIIFCRRSNSAPYRSTLVGIILSLIGTVLSSISYVAIIVTFSYFEEMRTLANLNISGLCATLLMYDIFYFSTALVYENATACKTVAVLWHWSSLAEQFWVLLTAILIFRNTKSLRQSLGSNIKKFRIYALIAYTVPLVLVTCLVSVDVAGYLDIGYGKNGLCWITSFESRLYFHVIPVSTVIVITTALLVGIVISIKHHQIKTQNLMKNRPRLQITKIAIRLIIIFGITEIVGFMQMTFSKVSETDKILGECISIFFILSKGYRGVLIGYIYLFNTKVLTLYQNLWRSLTNNDKQISSYDEAHQIATLKLSM